MTQVPADVLLKVEEALDKSNELLRRIYVSGSKKGHSEAMRLNSSALAALRPYIKPAEGEE